ncbi:hypothetical protein KSP40_PGU007093 [Platanthera guangdongensis]|uniref:RRM domain-containing protein n=1 Tax=Platanthera guangdongensis TaxID=2320717 RepID=A0ABR2MFE5_9ASPA
MTLINRHWKDPGRSSTPQHLQNWNPAKPFPNGASTLAISRKLCHNSRSPPFRSMEHRISDPGRSSTPQHLQNWNPAKPFPNGASTLAISRKLCHNSRSPPFRSMEHRISGLSYGTDDQSLREAFSGYGEVVEARVIIDRETGRSRGFGFITFTSVEEASAAVTAMDGKSIQNSSSDLVQDLHGRMVRVNYATDRYSGGDSYGKSGGAAGGYSGSGSGGFGGGSNQYNFNEQPGANTGSNYGDGSGLNDSLKDDFDAPDDDDFANRRG